MVKDGWSQTIHPGDRDAVMTKWRHCMETGASFDNVHRLRRFDGVYRWIHARFNPARDQHGAIARWYGLLLDVDDQKTAEQTLQKSEHQLRLILNAIPALVWCATAD